MSQHQLSQRLRGVVRRLELNYMNVTSWKTTELSAEQLQNCNMYIMVDKKTIRLLTCYNFAVVQQTVQQFSKMSHSHTLQLRYRQ